MPAGETPGDLFASWLNATSVLAGVLAIAFCACLAAVFLVADARRLGQRDRERYFLQRATIAAIVAGGLAIAGIGVLQIDAPILAGELTRTGWPFIVASGILGLSALLLLRLGARHAPARGRRGRRLVWGWGVAQYPDILPGTLSLAEAAAPSGSLDALLVIFIVAALVIAPSLLLLFVLDQRSRLTGHGLATGDDPAEPVKLG